MNEWMEDELDRRGFRVSIKRQAPGDYTIHCYYGRTLRFSGYGHSRAGALKKAYAHLVEPDKVVAIPMSAETREKLAEYQQLAHVGLEWMRNR